MRRARSFGKRRDRRYGRRLLWTEPLEQRELLAANAFQMGAAMGNGGSGQAEAPFGDIGSGENQAESPTMQRGRGGGGNNGPQGPGQSQPDPNPVQSDLSAAEIDDLLFMREEEKLARDVYMALGDVWTVPIFDNIAAAESQHMDALLQLIDKYELTDPVGNNPPGVFENSDLQTLYSELVVHGSNSVVDAHVVGAKIEELDIFDLRVAVADANHADVINVYENLMRGSRNHLRAFATQLDAANEGYEAQYLSQEEFEAIANLPMETGNGQGQQEGQGQQGHQGNGPQSDRPIDGKLGRDRVGTVWRRLRSSCNTANDNRDQDRIRDRDQDRTRPVKDNQKNATKDGQHVRARDRLFDDLGSRKGPRWF